MTILLSGHASTARGLLGLSNAISAALEWAHAGWRGDVRAFFPGFYGADIRRASDRGEPRGRHSLLFFSDAQLLWVYPKPIIPKGEISREETVRYPVYGVAYYDDSGRVIKYEKHEAEKTEWVCSYTYDDESRHKTSECSEADGSTRYLIYDDRGRPEHRNQEEVGRNGSSPNLGPVSTRRRRRSSAGMRFRAEGRRDDRVGGGERL